jgi:hypothetical protein
MLSRGVSSLTLLHYDSKCILMVIDNYNWAILADKFNVAIDSMLRLTIACEFEEVDWNEISVKFLVKLSENELSSLDQT